MKMTQEKRLRELKIAVDLCLSCLDNDDREVANRTLLSVSTIRRLRLGQYSLAVRFGTIQALAAAAGLRIEMTESRVRLAIV